ncbi:S-layer homology domain-containing protein [Aneurinibacillus sp. Ricciae_BoGa-3]|uniref:S-layer homology domain-containing protein n=1 Tax=Aneurinibacillus sp. Ricciae_BoGa-3 TaxID=3022697 RepID=UPI0023425C11|nr:S-layer homology domain-containing protein [Aneurinibacillus sp. Ricciae_BoGa-3]WCK55483.1 S-layer homology domain-containing protein [Aneurinibacillus sp. Ricciae_BoGa-3]
MPLNSLRLKKSVTPIALAAGILLQPGSAVYADTLGFTDVPANHWAWKNNTIQWALEKQIASGYPDHTFRPGNNVTEEEFLDMLIRLFPNTKAELDTTPVQEASPSRSDVLYKVASKYNLPVIGGMSQQDRGKPVTRGQVARLLAATAGKNYNTNNAIAFLYDNNISKGKKEETIKGFDSEGPISRAEAIQLLKKMDDQKLDLLMQICPQTQDLNASLSQYEKTSEEDIQRNIIAAKQFYPIDSKAGIFEDTYGYWVQTLYSLAKKSAIYNGRLRIYLPPLSEGTKIQYHVITDQWYEGDIPGQGGGSAPGYLEFPASKSWNFMLLVTKGNDILGDLSCNSDGTIEVNNTVIEKKQ